MNKTSKINKLTIGIFLVSIGGILTSLAGFTLFLREEYEYKWYIIAVGLLCSVSGVALIVKKRIEDNEIRKLRPFLIGAGLAVIWVIIVGTTTYINYLNVVS